MCIGGIGFSCQLRPGFYTSSFVGLGHSIREVVSFLHSVKMVRTLHVTSSRSTSYLNEGLPQGEVNNEGWPGGTS